MFWIQKIAKLRIKYKILLVFLNTTGLITKIEEVENKISDLSSLVTKTDSHTIIWDIKEKNYYFWL